MATYVLIHGAGSDSWYWHRVVPLLAAHGHTVVAPDLPCEDDSAGLAEYADEVIGALNAVDADGPLIVVGQSLAGFVAPLVCERTPVDLMVLLAAMVPRPHETVDSWWKDTAWQEARHEQARRAGWKHWKDFDVMRDFFHDVPPAVVQEAMARGERKQSSTPMKEKWPLRAWPRVPTRFLLCRDDRFFPADFMRRVVRERLGITPDEMDGGHLVALSRPRELAECLEQLRRTGGRESGGTRRVS